MKKIYSLIIICFIISSCKQKVEKIDNNDIYATIKEQELPVINNLIYEKTNNTKLPLGNSFINFGFDTEVITYDDKGSLIVTPVTIKLDSISKSSYRLTELVSKEKDSSDIEIKPLYGSKYLFDDINSYFFETIYTLPEIHDFKVSISKVSKILNPKNRTIEQYCLNIYDNKKLLNRYNIGYVYYGDLYETSKVWYIDDNYTISNRIITGVAGNNETYVGSLKKYKINENGILVSYFDQSNESYISDTQKGLIKNHLKEGVWIEKRINYKYVNSELYVQGNYTKGLQTGLWEFFKLETIEETNNQGYIVNTTKVKTNILLMTEEYSNDGELIKRKIIDD